MVVLCAVSAVWLPTCTSTKSLITWWCDELDIFPVALLLKFLWGWMVCDRFVDTFILSLREVPGNRNALLALGIGRVGPGGSWVLC